MVIVLALSPPPLTSEREHVLSYRLVVQGWGRGMVRSHGRPMLGYRWFAVCSYSAPECRVVLVTLDGSTLCLYFLYCSPIVFVFAIYLSC